MMIGKAKDEYRTEARVLLVTDTIENTKRNFRRLGVLRPFHYESWLRRILDNVDAISKENPEQEVAVKTLSLLFDKYTQESVDLAKKLKIENYECPVKWTE